MHGITTGKGSYDVHSIDGAYQYLINEVIPPEKRFEMGLVSMLYDAAKKGEEHERDGGANAET
jgi:hypothetical protein